MSPRKMPDLSDLIGVPFVDLGRDASTGLDCWGLVMEIHRRMGNALPDYAVASCFDSAAAFARLGEAVGSGLWERVDTPEPGDVLVLATDPNLPTCIDHCGVYVGNGRFLHTILKHNCILARMTDPWYAGRLRGAYRWRGAK